MKQISNIIISLSLLFVLVNCHSFSKYTISTNIKQEDTYIRYNNDSLKITMLMYGGYDIAQSEKELKLISPNDNGGKDKLFYLKNSIIKARTYQVVLSLSPKPIDYNKTYYSKTISCDGNHFVTLKLSDIDSSNVKLYLDNFKCIGKSNF
ncbi:hypothetical protein DRF60_09720 [Chryseobacterium elymi]|uniref:Uncharacterized protein n=1 Tax=Chryseobacterium elymi TaxID=395936 RepID=A0A3D9DIT7_9FLAO|nr:hypothetical protein [Chryseobacterium elymi]REC77940.1 hypothetical protein DRF60_09720 [Chryseobacterium elymi]